MSAEAPTPAKQEPSLAKEDGPAPTSDDDAGAGGGAVSAPAADESTESASGGNPQSTATTTTTSISSYKSLLSALRSDVPPPDPLPPGWILRQSSSSRPHAAVSSCYYYHQETGVCRWDPPGTTMNVDDDVAAPPPGGLSAEAVADAVAAAAAPRSILRAKRSAPGEDGGPESAADTAAAVKEEEMPPSERGGGASTFERGREMGSSLDRNTTTSVEPSPAKKSRRSAEEQHSKEPEQVRVLHILRKHRGSRRPASWRNPKITDNRDKAMADLGELISILKESVGDPKELRATFEELARTESDCSSAKRGGDLGFFGRRKMQPNFEKASFGLRIGELSDVVDTSSGVHVILRLA